MACKKGYKNMEKHMKEMMGENKRKKSKKRKSSKRKKK